jgi:23S rRNA pseudouridine1911/1915/1917 synthase
MTESTKLTISLDLKGNKSLRLDQYLKDYFKEGDEKLSRTRIQKLIDTGAILVNNKQVKASYKIQEKEQITIFLPEPIPLKIAAQEIPLSIVYEDKHLIVINKPAGMVTHPATSHREGTLVNALLHHCKKSLSGISGILRPGIVHRLDKDTSGLIVVAKNDVTHIALSNQIKERLVSRVYIALLEGTLPGERGEINKPIGRHPKDRKKMAVNEKGKISITNYETLYQLNKYSLIKASLKTGRTHQIRVHMASLNSPVVGDIVYNNKNSGSLLARKKLGLSGHALHAAYLTFIHPHTNELLQFEAPLPHDFQNLLKSLGVKNVFNYV